MQTSALLLSAACLLLLGSISCDYSKESFSDDLFDFAVRALRNKRESIVFSPLSAALALTAIGQNTHGDAKVEIEKLFRKEKLEIVWNRIVKTLITLREKGHIESKLVSRVYFDKSIKVKREFVSSLGNSTEATRTALQSHRRSTCAKINHAIKNQTEGHIEDYLACEKTHKKDLMLAADALYLKFPLHTTKNADPSFEDYYDRETIRDVYPVRAHTRPDQFIFGEKTIWTSRCEYMEIEHHKKGASVFFINYNSVPFNNAYKFSHLRSQASLQNGAEYILPKIKAQGSHSLKDLLFYRDFELLFTQNELRQISYGGDLYLNDINQKVAFEFTNGTSRDNSDKIQEYFEMHKKRSESDPLKLPLDMGSRFVYGVLIDGVPVIVGQEV